ncbi:MAG: DJ-1 family protein [Clostridia bacterium]|nr:DJ-1 family protein [Clostridia bacterium]
MPKKAAIMMADGFEEAEALVPYDLLCRAGVATDLVSVSGSETVTGKSGTKVTDLVPLDGYDFAALDALILPGGGGGYEILKANRTVCDEAVKLAGSPDKIVGGICASGALLGELGLLKGKKYTCYPTMNADFGGTYEKHDHAVTDGNIVTGVGPGGSFEFGFALVRKLAGKETEDALRRETCWKLG